MASIDDRIVRVGLTINGKTNWYQNYQIKAKGMKVSSTMAAETEITITGINSDTRNFILQNTKPGRATTRRNVRVTLEVGRLSYGAATYFIGDVYRSYPTKKPDLGVILKCLVGHSKKSTIVQRGGLGELTALSQIATWVADDNGYKLSFEITDRYIRNYSFTGSANEELVTLEDLANSDVYVDNDILYVKDSDAQAKGTSVFEVNNNNRTLLEASATEAGVVVKMLFHPAVTVGSVIDLESEINPSINGRYTVYKVNFDIAKRGTNFYNTVEALG